MNRYFRKLTAFAASAAVGLAMMGCAVADAGAATTDGAATAEASQTVSSAEATSADSAAGEKSKAPQSAAAASADAVVPDKTDLKKKDLTDTWDANAGQITLDGASASTNAAGVAVDGAQVTIREAGSYVVTGTLDNGRIIIEAPESEDVQIVLNGANITSQDGPGIHVKTADKAILTIAEGTQNTVTDAETYADTSDEAPNAAIYADTDLSINGKGTLTVSGNNNNGIGTKDDLKIANGTIQVTAKNNALKGKDSVSIADGIFKLESGGDAIQSDKADDAQKGWVVIDGGSFEIKAGNDAVQAETGMTINGGTFDVTTGGGAENAAAHTSQGGFGGQRPDFAQNAHDGMFGEDGGHKYKGQRPNRGQDTEGAAPEAGADAVQSENAALSVQPETEEAATATDAAEGSRRGPQGGTPGTQQDAAASAKPERPTTDSADGTSSGKPQRPTTDSADGTSSGKPQRPTTDSADGTSSGKPQRPNGTSGSTTSGSSESSKGLKADGLLTINGGTFNLNCADDAVHSNSSVNLNGGAFTISTGDDAVHADGELRVQTDVKIDKSYEGMEGSSVYIANGNIQIQSSDDCINAASDSRNGSGVVEISGGTVNAVGGGDGIDSNGDIRISGGDVTVLINSSADNCAMDAERTFTATGGKIIYGGTGTGAGPGNGSTQSYVFAQGSFAAGTEVSLRKDGQVLASFTPSIDCTSLSFSMPGIVGGDTYEVYAGDTLAATAAAGQGSTGMAGGFGGGMGGGRPGGFGNGEANGNQPAGDMQQPPEMDGTMPEPPDGVQGERPQRPDSGNAPDGIASATQNGAQ